MSPTEITELLSAAEEMTNAMSETWREMLPLPFHVQAEQRAKQVTLVVHRVALPKKTLTHTGAAA